jgi:hypothetical protein
MIALSPMMSLPSLTGRSRPADRCLRDRPVALRDDGKRASTQLKDALAIMADPAAVGA